LYCYTVIAPSNTVMERLANRRRAIAAAALKTLQRTAATSTSGSGGGGASSVLGLDAGTSGGDVEEGRTGASSQLGEFCAAAVVGLYTLKPG
jgi:hypothetical protein